MNGIELTSTSSSMGPLDDRSQRPWTAASSIHAVWAAGVLILCGAWTACGWRLIDAQTRQHAARMSLSQQFHADLVREMRTISGQSAASVTSDLCRVRFRLRLRNGGSPPAGTFSMVLTQTDRSGTPLIDFLPLQIGNEKIADFGLLPPGNYQLQIEDELEMHCTHTFQVLPGVPVDRVAYCPDYQSWMFLQETASFDLHLDWPTLWESEPIAAVVHLRGGATQVDQWVWQPPVDQQFDGSAVVSPSGTQIEWDQVHRALPAGLTEFSEPLHADPTLQGRYRVSLPYGCCEVYGVSFIAVGGDDTTTGCVHLGTYFYGDPHRASIPDGLSGNVVFVAGNCPRQHVDDAPAALRIAIPDAVVPMVLHTIRQKSPNGA